MAVIILVGGNHPGLLSVLVNLASQALRCMIANVEIVLPQGLANLVNGFLSRIGRNLGSTSGRSLLGQYPETTAIPKRRRRRGIASSLKPTLLACGLSTFQDPELGGLVVPTGRLHRCLGSCSSNRSHGGSGSDLDNFELVAHCVVGIRFFV
jgi:hypothetical protein